MNNAGKALGCLKLLAMGLAATLLLTVPGAAQVQFASITGVVADQTGAVIPGADVTLSNVSTGLTETTQTGPTGVYRFNELPIAGKYKVEVSATGFKTAAKTGITLNAGTVARVDFEMQLGERGEVVIVEGVPALVSTEDSRPSVSVVGRQVEEFPLNGRNVYNLIQLAPGAVNVTGVSDENGENTSVNGLRQNFNGFLINGISNKGLSGGTVTLPNPDIVAEFQMLTLNMSAQYGTSAAAITNLVTKSGTNDFHGSLFYFYRDEWMDANEFFRNQSGNEIAPLRFNQFGGSATGPIIKDKVFFTASYQGSRFLTQLGSEPLVQETSAWRQAIASLFPNSAANLLYGTFAPAGSPVTGSTISLQDYIASGVSASGFTTFAEYMCPELLDGTGGLFLSEATALAQQFQSLFGVTAQDITEMNTLGCSAIPGAPFAGLVDRNIGFLEQSVLLAASQGRTGEQATGNLFDGNEWSTRIDWTGKKNRIFGELYWQLSKDKFGPSNANQSGGRGFFNPTEAFSPNLSFSWVSTIRPTVINELRAGVSRARDEILVSTPGVPDIEFLDGSMGIGSYNGYPQLFYETIYNYSDMVSISHGSHNLKAGIEFRRNYENSDFNVARPSIYFFDPLFFLFDAGAEQVAGVDPGFATGRPAELSSNNRAWRNLEMGTFIQDDWKVTPNVTLNLGLRYDLYTRHVEKFGRETTFIRGPGVDLIDQIFNANIPAGDPGCDTADQIARAQLAGVCGPGGFATAESLGQGDHNNFGPRFGIAWDPFGKGTTVIRGGVGISYEGTLYNPLSNSRWNLPYYSFNIVDNFLFGDTGTVVYGPPTGQAPRFDGEPGNIGMGSGSQATGNLTGWDPNNANLAFLTGIVFPEGIKDPWIANWHIGVQHEFLPNTVFELSYVGTQGHKLFRAQQVNRRRGGQLDAGTTVVAQGDTLVGLGRRRLNPNYGAMRVWQNVSKSWYNALQVSVRKAYSQGFMFGASYSWSHTLDTGSTWHSGSTSANGPAAGEGYSLDQTNLDLDKGNSIFDIRHRFVVNYLWDIPLYKDQQGVAGYVLGGWQWNGIFSAQSGAHFSPFCNRSFGAGCDFNADGERNDRPDVGPAGVDINPTHDMWANGWLNASSLTAADLFSTPCIGCNGNYPRNGLEGPGLATFDMSIFKNIPLRKLSESAKLQFRLEFFNIFNHTNFRIPRNDVSGANLTTSADFGKASGTFNPRQIQLGLKLLW